jgi:hypothetical protein
MQTDVFGRFLKYLLSSFFSPLFIMRKHFLKAALALFGLVATSTASAQISTATLVVRDTATRPTSVQATPAAICTGSSTTLTRTGGTAGNGGSWQWSQGSCNGTPVTTNAVTGEATVSPTNATTAPIIVKYFLRATGGACASSICDSVSVTVNPTPIATVPANVIACTGGTVSTINLTGTPTGVVFDVSHSNTAIGVSNATGVTSIPSFTAVNTGTAPIVDVVTITPRANGCTGTAVTFSITVNPGATVNATADAAACNGTSVGGFAFTSGTSGGTITYAWTNDDPTIGLAASGTGNIAAFNVANTGVTNKVARIVVTPTYANGGASCIGATDTFLITAYPTPNGTLAVTTPICEGQAVDLTFTSTVSGAPGPYSLNVSQYRQGTTPPATPTTYTNIVSGTSFGAAAPLPTSSGTYLFDLVRITDANGCVRQ